MLKDTKMICRPTINRLFLYYRTLFQLQEELQHVVSSEELGQRLGITSETIRKDLTLFGKFGKKGVGYHVNELMINIKEVLGLNSLWNIAVVGAGNFGNALVNYHNFETMGFNLMAIFDIDPNKIGSTINGITVSHIDMLEELILEKNIQMGIITVPQGNAQEVTEKLVDAGIIGIWNFAPIEIKVPSNVQIINEDLAVGLSSLSFYVKQQQRLMQNECLVKRNFPFTAV